MTIYLFKEGDAERVRDELESCFSAHGARLTWGKSEPDSSFEFAATESVITFCPSMGCHSIADMLGVKLNIPWMSVFLQEKSFWEYVLHVGSEPIDKFSVASKEWGRNKKETREWIGNAKKLADVWGIAEEKIARYLVDWDPGEVWSDHMQAKVHGFRLSGKAYPEDKYEYGDIWQVADFVRTLGGLMPEYGIPCAVEGLKFPR